jgi:hypothetical protein
MVYQSYIYADMSIGAITRLLNERGVPTRKQISRWERSTVWAMLRNPAYKGRRALGKPRPHRVNASPDRSGCAGALARATAFTTNDRVPTGSKSRFPRSLRTILSCESKSGSSKTRRLCHVGRSNPASCRAWCRAGNAAMRCRTSTRSCRVGRSCRRQPPIELVLDQAGILQQSDDFSPHKPGRGDPDESGDYHTLGRQDGARRRNPGIGNSGWILRALQAPGERPAARCGADPFTVMDFHLQPPAGLPAHRGSISHPT